MEFLRLLENSNSFSEYYVNGSKAQYLGGIKNINIIVGANNTRKSRFLRKVINIELKVLIRSNENINELLQGTDELIQGIQKWMNLEYLIAFSFNTPYIETEPYKRLKHIMENRARPGNRINVLDVKKMVEEIRDGFASTSLEDRVKELSIKVSSHHEIISLLSQLYVQYSNDPRLFRRSGLFSTIIDGLDYSFPNEEHVFKDTELESLAYSLLQISEWLKKLKEIEIIPYHDANVVYIPVLRSSMTLDGGAKDIFSKTIKKQYNISDNSKISVETGLDLYNKIEAARNGHRSDRDNFADFERFLSKVFFNNREIDIIAVKGAEKDNYVKISMEGDNDDIAIHDLGDGIQAIIILLLPVFMAKEGSWIFIDEPENNLHPGFQNIFIKAITEHKDIISKNLRFFINTHSNHILTEALLSNSDKEILVFNRRDKDTSSISVFDGNEQTTLEMLGVLNTSVLISNCSIWVEGITDRLYLRAFMNAYFKNQSNFEKIPIEGFHYSFVEYAGNNLVHYSFDHELKKEDDDLLDQQIRAFFINSNVFLLADSDFSKDKKHAFYEEISKKRDNFRYFKTELPEIENLLPNSIITSWLIGDLEADQTEVDKIFRISNKNKKLGAYLNGKVSYKGGKRKFMKDKEGGTLRSDYKSKLADFVHKGVSNGTISWKQLSESIIIKELIIELLKFIKEKGQRSSD